jgi:hypothetical protein
VDLSLSVGLSDEISPLGQPMTVARKIRSYASRKCA